MTEEQQLKEFHKACQSIVDNQELEVLNWAVNYAKHGLTVTSLYEAKIQAIYILGNTSYWRGELAKEIRAILKKITR